MLARPVLLLLALFLGAPPSAAQTTTIEGVTLTLGEPRAAAMERLRAKAQLQQVPGGDNWIITVPRPHAPYYGVGSVGFTNGKLSFISRQWPADESAQAYRAVQSAIRAIAQLERSSPGRCTVAPQRIQQPGTDLEEVKVVCGRHSVSIVSGESDGHGTISISESWRLQ